MEHLDAYDQLDSPSVTILTANELNLFDEAVIRPGRITLNLEVKGFTESCQLSRYINYLCGESDEIDPQLMAKVISKQPRVSELHLILARCRNVSECVGALTRYVQI